jgi:toxin ParE1/3/4
LNISVTPAAIADLEAIRDYIAHFNQRAADQIIARIDTSIAFLAAFPEIGRRGRVAGTRELVVPDTNYIIVYEIPNALDIYILTVLHGREQFPPLMD